MKAWSTARVENEAKTKVDATARAHGESVSMLNSDWTSLMRKFREQYGKHLEEEDLPAQSYYEQIEETAHSCGQRTRREGPESAQTDPLVSLVSALAIRPYTIHVQAVGSCQPCQTSTEQFRDMSNCALTSDLTEMTFPRFCDELLSQKNFLLDKEFGPKRITAPDWDICMACELEIRREAVRLATEEGYAVERAWWSAYENDHHRMEHVWQRFLGVAC